ncbi:MAG: class I SAM-dependent methyltransferase [Myxococcota bacterium]|nr:class I SAM-dependent methyltransferase [Myxococcota bacterium]
MTPGPQLIREGADALEVSLTGEAADALWVLVERLLRWNRKINLVGPCDPIEAIDRHIHDGLGLLRLLDREEVRTTTTTWTDVGAGAGLPGLVLAIARPSWRMRLVEPVGKKIAFAQDIVAALGLDGVEVVQGRLEALEAGVAQGAMSRATFPPHEWVERGREFVAPGGLVLVTMGGEPVDSVVDVAWRVDRFSLPISDAGRTTALVKT